MINLKKINIIVLLLYVYDNHHKWHILQTRL